MNGIISFADSKERLRRQNGGLDPVVAEIVLALLTSNGAAHRNTVADMVLSARDDAPPRSSAAARQEIFDAFDAYLKAERPRSVRPLVHLPFGDGSHRWALTPLSLAALQGLRGRVVG
jgi:hypothetical protein